MSFIMEKTKNEGMKSYAELLVSMISNKRQKASNDTYLHIQRLKAGSLPCYNL